MTEINALIDNYIAIWNEGDPERRRAHIAQTWTEDASYVDPMRPARVPPGSTR